LFLLWPKGLFLVFNWRANLPTQQDIRISPEKGADCFEKGSRRRQGYDGQEWLEAEIAGGCPAENLNLLALNFVVEPGLGVGPALLDGALGQPKNFGRFRDRHSGR
jgi:hypothetical protein